MSQFDSPLCKITWTEVVQGTQRFAVEVLGPLQLRFGLRIDPSFWSVSAFGQSYFIDFQVFRRGGLITNHTHGGETAELLDILVAASELPGAPPTEELWLGKSFGRAGQVSMGLTGICAFHPQIWFPRFGPDGYIPGEFAAAPEQHYFAVERSDLLSPSHADSEHFIAGAGLPPP